MRLREEHVHCRDLDQDPHAVHDVVFPANAVQRNRVHVGIEEDGEPDGQLLDCDALGTLLIGEHFDLLS